MTAPATPDVTTWRDLADKLTARQIAELEEFESLHRGDVEHRGADPEAYRIWMIGEARDYVETNQSDAELNARIQPPAGVTEVGGWDSLDPKTGLKIRTIQWAAFGDGPISVHIEGWQDETGTYDGPQLSVFGLEEGRAIDVDAARQLVADLTAAVDEFQRLT